MSLLNYTVAATEPCVVQLSARNVWLSKKGLLVLKLAAAYLTWVQPRILSLNQCF